LALNLSQKNLNSKTTTEVTTSATNTFHVCQTDMENKVFGDQKSLLQKMLCQDLKTFEKSLKINSQTSES